MICILGVTLTPAGTEFQPDFTSCIICGSRGWADAIANLILYAPLGAALAWNRRVGWRAVGAAFLLSACIELAQTVIPGRDPSLGDVTFNTLGATAGQLAVLGAPRWLVPAARAAARLSLACAALAAAVFALTGVLLAPPVPSGALEIWYTPALPELPWYHARVLDARLGAVSLHTGRLPDSARTLLVAGAPLTITALAGPAVPALGPLITIEDQTVDPVYLVGPDRTDLVLRTRMRAATWRLDQKDIRLRGAAVGIARGDTIRVGIRRNGSSYCLSLNSQQRCGLGYTIGAAWAFVLYPSHWPPWSHALLDAMWVGGLALPIGFWMRRRVESGLAVGLFASALALVPLLVGLLATPTREWCGALIGLGTGLALQVGARRATASNATAT